MKVTLKKVLNKWVTCTIYCIDNTTLVDNEYIAGCIAQKMVQQKLKVLIIGDDGFALPRFIKKFRDGIPSKMLPKIEKRVIFTINRSFAYTLVHDTDRIIAEHFDVIICLFPQTIMYDKFLKKLPDLAPISFVFKEFRKWLTPMTPFPFDETNIDQMIHNITHLK